MATETLILNVDPEAARAYNQASDDQQKKLLALVNLWLKRLPRSDPSSLLALMDQIGAAAQSRGMTPKILESILHEK